MKRISPVVFLLLAACQEYNFASDPSFYAEPNPPDLSAPVIDDRIVQVTVPATDVLWVIDNSCSMLEEQTALTANFSTFMQYFVDSGLDYHVGVINTDNDTPFTNGDAGRLRTLPSSRKWIDSTTVDPVGDFAWMASMGTDGTSDEVGRDVIYAALGTEREAYNLGFVRDDAWLSVIVISDEPDASFMQTSYFVNWMRNLKGDPEMVTFSAIVGPYGGCASASSGADYLTVQEQVGGIPWNICDSNWAGVLELLGVQAAGLKREFFLSQVPVEETIEVWVDDESIEDDDPDDDEDPGVTEFEAGDDYVYDRTRNSVTFNSFIPLPLTEVHIRYQALAGTIEEPF